VISLSTWRWGSRGLTPQRDGKSWKQKHWSHSVKNKTNVRSHRQNEVSKSSTIHRTFLTQRHPLFELLKEALRGRKFSGGDEVKE